MKDCNHCKKLCGGIDPSTGELGCDCPEWIRMTDEDVKRSNEGKCPYWVPIEGEGLQ